MCIYRVSKLCFTDNLNIKGLYLYTSVQSLFLLKNVLYFKILSTTLKKYQENLKAMPSVLPEKFIDSRLQVSKNI